jgi:peptide/nickel transport system substrate-binding protein
MCNPVKPVGSPNYYLPLIQGMQDYCNPYLTNTSIASNLGAMEAYEDGHQIPGVQALDAGTIQFRLNEPASDFLNLLSMTFTSAMPQEYYRYTPGSLAEYNHLVSAGPYQVQSYSPGKSLTLVRNPSWSKSTDPLRNQYVDTIQITEGQPNPQAVLQLLQSGSQDLAYDVAMDPSTLSQLAGRNDPNLTVNGPPIGNPYLVFNLLSRNEGGAMGKVQVRQAIEYAINKVNLAKVYGGPKYNTPLNGVVPPDSVGYKDFNLYPTPNNQGDAAKCKQMLAQAGYPGGLTLKATYRQTGVHPLIYQSYAQDLAACGIRVTGTAQQGADFYAYLQTTNNARQSRWDISAPGWSPDWFGNNGRANLQPLFSGQNWADGTSNYGDYDSPVTNALIEKANTSRTEADANAAWQAVNEQVMKDAVIVPFMAQKTPWYHSSRVRHAIWVPISQQFDYTNLWLS